MNHIEKEKLIKADIASIENRVRHAFNQGYDLGFKDSKKRAKPLEQEPTTKNCESCRYYGSHHEVCNYCYKCSLWTEKEATTKNDLRVDAVSRDEVCRYVAEFVNHEFSTREEEELIDNIITGIEHMPSVMPQEPKTGHWIDADGDNAICGCCNRLNHLYGTYCKHCGARMVEPQESEDKE